MFFFWQVLGAGSAHSHLLLRLKIINPPKRAVGLICAEDRHAACPVSSAARTSNPACRTPAAWTGASATRKRSRCSVWQGNLFAFQWLATVHRWRGDEENVYPALQKWDIHLASDSPSPWGCWWGCHLVTHLRYGDGQKAVELKQDFLYSE